MAITKTTHNAHFKSVEHVKKLVKTPINNTLKKQFPANMKQPRWTGLPGADAPRKAKGKKA
jgi:hypothetical protein